MKTGKIPGAKGMGEVQTAIVPQLLGLLTAERPSCAAKAGQRESIYTGDIRTQSRPCAAAQAEERNASRLPPDTAQSVR